MRACFSILSILAVFGVSGCGPTPQVGGAGAEAGNAITVSVISQTGQGVASAMIEIRPYDSDDMAATYTATTGADGSARIELPTGGEWSIVASKDGKAFWDLTSPGSDTILDTLRLMSQLSGIIEGSPGATITMPGIGVRAICGPDGFFSMESLPSGMLPIRLTALNSAAPQAAPGLLRKAQTLPATHKYPEQSSVASLQPGQRSIIVTASSDIPRILAVPADTLVAWYDRVLPAVPPHRMLDDSGAFLLTVQLRAVDILGPIEAISWTDGASRGIKIGWQGSDTMIVVLDGIRHEIPYVPFARGMEHMVGVSWNGQSLSISVDNMDSYFQATESFARRGEWNAPEFGVTGIAKTKWFATLQGDRIYTYWFSELYRMWRNMSISGSF